MLIRPLFALSVTFLERSSFAFTILAINFVYMVSLLPPAGEGKKRYPGIKVDWQSSS